MRPFKKTVIWLMPSLFFLSFTSAQAVWEQEAGLRMGYDSNLDRAISSPQGSGYGSGYFSLNREPDGEARLDWSLWSQVEGTAYFRLPDVNGAVITLAPGVTYVPHKDWLVSVVPFVQAKSVVDAEQSSLAWGGKFALKQRWVEGIYSGQYYLFKDSRAQEDIYSYTENTLGLFLGVKWTAKLFAEIGYEFSRGDSFLSIDHQVPTTVDGSGGGAGNGPGGEAGGATGGGPGGGSGTGGGSGRGNNKIQAEGKGPRYSSAFDSTVIRENVNRHSLGLTLGIDWNKAIYSLAGYTYTTLQGDSGTAANHAVFISTGYRF